MGRLFHLCRSAVADGDGEAAETPGMKLEA
jgi:hypothetical protein